jgi:hypothetical protein
MHSTVGVEMMQDTLHGVSSGYGICSAARVYHHHQLLGWDFMCPLPGCPPLALLLKVLILVNY